MAELPLECLLGSDWRQENSERQLLSSVDEGFCLYDALRHLVAFGNGGVAKDEVCCSKLAFTMDEYLGL